jgi:pantetheine-phosphate adenylyltransferase
MPSTALYAGSFDPMTRGHEDLIRRAVGFVDRLIVAVATNPSKQPIFTVDERVQLIRESLGDVARVDVEHFDGLLVDFARRTGARLLIRGLRAVSDFEYEFQLASMNRKLAKDVETVFMMTSEESFYLSSRLVREVASFGGNVSEMVPPPVYAALKKRFSKKGRT